MCHANVSWASHKSGQKSWDKFTFVALFHTRQTSSQARIHLHMFSPSSAPPPPPTHPLQCWTRVRAISPEVQHCMEGGKQHILKQKTALFLKFRFKHTEIKINAITQVSQGTLSAIVTT